MTETYPVQNLVIAEERGFERKKGCCNTARAGDANALAELLTAVIVELPLSDTGGLACCSDNYVCVGESGEAQNLGWLPSASANYDGTML